MSRLLFFASLLALACGRVNRDVGSYKPPLGEVGAGGEAGAANRPDTPENGSSLELDKPWKSSGCGMPLPNKQPNADGFTSWELTQPGETLTTSDPALANTRSYLVHVPDDYDPSRPYRIVYLLQGGCYGPGEVSMNVLDLANASQGGDPQAIYVDVGMPGLDVNPHCYDTGTGTESLEYEAFELMHSSVESRYCVDNNRIFVAGYSQGGALSNMWGCYFAGTPTPARKFSPRWAIRGHAVVGGWREPNEPQPCNGPDAAIWIQETGDSVSSMYEDSNPSALMVALNADGCTGNYDEGPKQPWAPAGDIAGFKPGDCQRYTGCSAQTLREHPLVYCRVDDAPGTDRPDLAIPAFTAFFHSMDPSP